MPGRLIQDCASAAEFFGSFGVDDGGLPAEWKARFNVSPGQKVFVVRRVGAITMAEPMSWGMVLRSGNYGPQKFARSERLAQMRSFERLRCVVPMTGWYEWLPTEKGKKVYCLRPVDGRPLALAGIFDDEPEGPAFGVVTCAPNADVAPLHDRMGVFLDPEGVQTWLDPGASPTALRALLRQWPAGRFRHFEVSSYVSNTRNEGPHCIEPLGEDKPSLFS